jgi:hypothetical protein
MAFANDCLDHLGACLNELKVLSVGQGTVDSVYFQLVDVKTGTPVDLTQYGLGATSSSSSCSENSSTSTIECPTNGVMITIKEMEWSHLPMHQGMAEIVSDQDAAQGIVKINFDATATSYAGIWVGTATIYEMGVRKKIYPFYYEVMPNLEFKNDPGPLTMFEVRLAVRDTCPEINFLIDTVDFKEHEIAWAMRRPIDYWNEVPPPIGEFTAVTFPYRYHWLEATVGQLLILVAHWMRRNDLDYNAGGVSVADTKKWPDYLKMGQERWKAYQDFVKQKKIEINILGAFADLGGYRFNPQR